MTDSQKVKIRQLVWQSKAKGTREYVKGVFTTCGQEEVEFAFLDEEHTRVFGEKFWTAAKTKDEKSVSGFDQCLKMLREVPWTPGLVIYIHSKTRETGAIQIEFTELMHRAACLREKLGPDFLFMDRDGKSGFCYEEGELDRFCRVWRHSPSIW